VREGKKENLKGVSAKESEKESEKEDEKEKEIKEKVNVSFAEYRLFYRPLLQKRPIILRSLLIVATP